MTRSRRARLAMCLAAGLLIAVSAMGQTEPPETPHEVGLVEQTGRRLIQIDVTVRGPSGAVANLNAGDFVLDVGGREIEAFSVDRICDDVVAEPLLAQGRPAPSGAAGEPSEPAPVGATYLFYFDQHHLKIEGRHRAIELARELVGELIAGRSRASIVSSGQEVKTFSELTSDRQQLLDALDRLEHDTKQWDSYAAQEDFRVQEVFAALAAGTESARSQQQVDSQEMALIDSQIQAASGPDLGGANQAATRGLRQERAGLERNSQAAEQIGLNHARSVARMHQREERRHTENALRRFSMVLGRLQAVEPPKAVLYFADTMRSNPGNHYMSLLAGAAGRAGAVADTRGVGGQSSLPDAGMLQIAAGSDLSAFEDLINEAATHGVRLYTIQAEGLVSGISSTSAFSLGGRGLSANPRAASLRFDDARNSLVGLALETGGQAFLDGLSAAGIGERVRADLGCIYLLSFDARSLAQDRRHSVFVRVDRPGVEARTRSRLFVKSASAALESRLSTAFVAPAQLATDRMLRAALVPTGFEKGKFLALVQVAVPGSEFSPATWDLGLSVVAGGKKTVAASGRISVNRPGVPLVFETVLRFAPGPYEIVAVAHEIGGADRVVTRKIAGTWPDPSQTPAVVGPIALLQPASGVFVRDGEQRRSGSLGLGDGDWLRPEQPSALVGIVCRSRFKKGALTVSRSLTGASTTAFEPMDVESKDGRCAVFSDRIQAGALGSGSFHYDVRVLDGTQPLAETVFDFVAVSPGDR